jgi:Rrf2 family protein
MQLTRAADYAVRVMIHLASQPEGAVVSRKVLAIAAEAPESFLSKILQLLSRAGLIQTRRGVVGGFSLLSRGVQASMLDVVECIDGPIALNVCVTSGISCNRQGRCAAHEVWVRAQNAMLSVLREARIAEMIPARNLCEIPTTLTQVSGSIESELMLPSDLPHKPRIRTRTELSSIGAPHVGTRKQNTKN